MPTKSKIQINNELKLYLKPFCKHSFESRVKRSERMTKTWGQRKTERMEPNACHQSGEDREVEWALKKKGK